MSQSSPIQVSLDFYLLPNEEDSTTQETVTSLAEALQEVRLPNLEEQDLLQKGVQKTTEPKKNKSIWYINNPDDRRKGILFGTIISKECSDYIVKTPGGEEVKLSPTRLYMIYDQEDSIPYLLRDLTP